MHLRLIRCLLPACLLSGTAMAQMFVIDAAGQPITLQPNLAGQQVQIYMTNSESTPLQVDAATLKFQLDDGAGGNNAPVITAIDAVTGTPWALAGGFQTIQTSLEEYWDVRVFSNFFAGQHAVLPGDEPTLLATLTLDTTGLVSGTWSFRMAGLDVDPINTKFEVTGGGTYFPNATLGSVSIITPVPEPATVALATGLGLIAFAVVRAPRASGRRR